MARHSSGKNNYSLSSNAIIALIALIAVIALIVWFFFFRGDSSEPVAEQECVSGELEVPVAAANDEVAQSLIDDWAESQPVVRDYCAQPVLVDSIEKAAVYIGADNASTEQALADASRTTAESEPSAVATQAYGLDGEAEADQVNYSSAPDATSAAVVASALSDDEEAAESALAGGGDVDIVAADADGASPVDGAEVTYYAFPLAANDTVNEDQIRAGSALADFGSENFSGEEANPEISDAVLAAASSSVTGTTPAPSTSEEAPAEEPEESEAAVEPRNTLYLVDTSAAMEPFSDAVAAAVGDASDALVEDGQQVALWNYSSPLNPGVTQSWRTNIPFTTEPGAVANSVDLLGNGGQSNTRVSLEAALQSVAGEGEDYRVVLITAGSDDVGPDAEYVEALSPLLEDGVELSVVHVGDAGVDLGVEQLASSHSAVTSNDEIAGAVEEASGV